MSRLKVLPPETIVSLVRAVEGGLSLEQTRSGTYIIDLIDAQIRMHSQKTGVEGVVEAFDLWDKARGIK